MNKQLITLAFILFGYAVTSQNFAKNPRKVDSLIQLLKTKSDDSTKVTDLHYLFDYYVYKDAKKAKYYADEELKISKLINYDAGIANALYNYGVYYNAIDQSDSAIVYYKKAYDLFEKKQNYRGMGTSNKGIAIIEQYRGNNDKALEIAIKDIDLYKNQLPDSIRLGIAYDFISIIYTAKGNYKLAIANSLKAVRILEQTDKPIRLADAISHLANSEFSLKNFEKSLKHKKKALNIYKENNDNYYTTETLNGIGIIHYYLKDYDKSITYLKQGLALANKLKLIDIKRTLLDNLGKVYTATGDYNEAQKYLNEALKNAEENKQDYWKPIILNNLGDLYNKTNNLEKALSVLSEAEEIGHSFSNLSTLKDSYFNRHESYLKLKQPELALTDYKAYIKINDSLYNIEKLKEIEELKTIYETEKKEQQIQIQKNEIDFLNIKGKVNKQQRMLLSLGLLLTIIALYAYYQRNKRNKLAKEKAEADLEFKTKELTTHALHLAKKNEVLNDLKQKAKVLKANANADPGYQMLIQTINFDLQDDNNWENFSKYFEEVHKDFNHKAQEKFPAISSNDLRLMALMKMNLSSKEIANILNISSDGIKKARQRLRKKMGIASTDSLEAIVIAI